MKPATSTNPALTPEQAERIREHYRKCALEVILLPTEVLADECPELIARTVVLREARRAVNARPPDAEDPPPAQPGAPLEHD